MCKNAGLLQWNTYVQNQLTAILRTDLITLMFI
jgi:hypothetical protein